MSHGLARRPEPDPEDLAAVVAAVLELSRTAPALEADRVPGWRFSGRWFNVGPYSGRRPGRAS